MCKIVSSILSLLILLSSSQLAYAQHFCGGHEVASELVIGAKDLSCGMAMDDGICCDDQNTKVEIDDNFSIFNFSFDLDISIDFYNVHADFDLAFNEIEIKNQFYSDYSPPPLERDLNILYQTFLI